MTEQRYDKIVEAVKNADEAYYNDPEKSSMSDAEYDALYDDLLRMEAENPSIIRRDSPTQNLQSGGNLFDKVRHDRPMLSLDKITSLEELEKFVVDIGLSTEFEVTPKLDGMALSLNYDSRGYLVKAVSRGDGEVGEDLTQNTKYVLGIPNRINSKNACSIRGEIVIFKEDFETMKDEFANARNAAAGAIRSKDPTDARDRKLHFLAYDLVDDTISTAREAAEKLDMLGFLIPPTTLTKGVVQCADAVELIMDNRDNLPYEIDGVVIKVNDYSRRIELGARSRSPRWACAFKQAGETATTELLKIDWQVGKSGIIAPVAILQPVFLAGTTISRATLHNLKYIEDNALYEGATVTIIRAGQVIPRVEGLAVDGTGAEVVPPTSCPSCGGEITIATESKIVKCSNYSCSMQIIGRLEMWCSRKAANIDAIGGSWITRMVMEDYNGSGA